MSAEFDQDLAPDQWDALKLLRAPLAARSTPARSVLSELVIRGLVEMRGDLPAITDQGRKALIRGSTRLWDVAA